MGPFAETKQKKKCAECGEKMYRLPGSTEPIFVCPKCGNSVDDVCDESNIFSNEETMIDEKKQMMKKLFPDYFMKKYTNFDSFIEFIDHCKFIRCDVKEISNKTFEKLPKGKWDRFVKNNTCFSSWNEMFECAVERYLKL